MQKGDIKTIRNIEFMRYLATKWHIKKYIENRSEFNQNLA